MLGISVLEAAQQRIAWAFDVFPRIYISFSGGKDSTAMSHLVMAEAIKRGRKVGLLHIDLEAWYKTTSDHVAAIFDLYAEHIEPFHVCLPFPMENASSMIEPEWITWEPGKEESWIRQPPTGAITIANAGTRLPEYHWDAHSPMEFEQFLPAFGDWYSKGKLTACFVGIRSGESLNRWRTVAGHGTKFEGRNWTQHVMRSLWNIYPIYDWKTEDIWSYFGKSGKPYNRIYDRMHQAGIPIHSQRLCQPYGNDQRKGLWLFHVLEPETWMRIVARVTGANQAALYAKERGNILGNAKVVKPAGHSWKSYAHFLLDSMPTATAENYKDKLAVYIRWYQVNRGLSDLHDELPNDCGSEDMPSWRRVCKMLLKGDYFARMLNFNFHKSAGAHQKYKELMARRRNTWGIYPLEEVEK